MQVTDEMVRVAAEAISRSFHEEGYIEGVSDPSEWDEFMKAARLAITAALAAMWQPIETAPSGERVIVCGYARAGYYVTDAMLVDGSWMLFDLQDDTYSVESSGHTHWMPLPPAPSQLSKRDDAERDSIQEA